MEETDPDLVDSVGSGPRHRLSSKLGHGGPSPAGHLDPWASFYNWASEEQELGLGIDADLIKSIFYCH